MGTFWFLLFIAASAFALVCMINRSSRRKDGRRDAERNQARHAEPLYRHRMAGHALLHTHTQAHHQDIWHTRRAQATRERWEAGHSMTATHIRSDEELEQQGEEEVSMSAIEYTPTEVTRAGGGKR